MIHTYSYNIHCASVMGGSFPQVPARSRAAASTFASCCAVTSAWSRKRRNATGRPQWTDSKTLRQCLAPISTNSNLLVSSHSQSFKEHRNRLWDSVGICIPLHSSGSDGDQQEHFETKELVTSSSPSKGTLKRMACNGPKLWEPETQRLTSLFHIYLVSVSVCSVETLMTVQATHALPLPSSFSLQHQ